INPEKNNSQGLPMPNIDIAIIKEGKVATNLELGEICVSSPSVMNGYFDSASPHFSTIDGKSYLHTGDVGYLDDEGYLYIKDRLKRIVIIGGINIFPQEVESLIASIEGVNGVCIARYLDNGKARTKAYIELKSGMILNAKLQTLIADVVQKNIMKYAVPSNFEQVDSIKLNKMGKVDFSYYENLLKNEQIS
ncbi:MAG TPA: class I adenylate-forming enzyme family protein, partial [Clostridia bacterium]|nr:class I adenylate-forming enzyme family protein [Clostridia bacterium]